MCLSNISKRKTATKDIVVYKWLKEEVGFSGDYHNKPFKGVINGITCEGILIVDRSQLFFCTNDLRMNGRRPYCTIPVEYRYSWVYDHNVDLDNTTVDKPLKMVDILVTPYLDMQVEIGKVYKSELVPDDTTLNEGLHSFRLKRGAKEDSRYENSVVIVRCIIPKGSNYYTGTFAMNAALASDTLVYEKIVN